MAYTREIASAICEQLAAGKSLRSICKAEGMPSEAAVRAWAIDDIEGFAAQYTRARDIGLDCLADELREISDTTVEGTKTATKEWGTEVTKGDMIEHRKLQIDTRKWYLSKLAPKRYGDKQAIEHSGEVGVRNLSSRMRNRGPLA